MSILRDYMDTNSYMIVTERGYFLVKDCLEKEVDKAIEIFKTKYNFNFNTVVDVIKSPYEEFEKETDRLDFLYNEGKLDDDSYNKEYDKVLDKYVDLNRNALLMIYLDPQM